MSASAESSLDRLSLHDLKQRYSALETLVAITQQLAAAIDLDEILRIVANGACQALDCERASLFQFDEKTNELYTRVTTQLEIAEIRSPISRGLSGHAARQRELVNVSDPQADPRWNSAVDQQTGFHTRNVLAAPVRSPHHDRLLGVLELINKRERAFDEFDEQLARAFSGHAAVALDRALLVEEIQSRHAVEVSLNVAREIQRGFMPSTLPEIDHYEVATWWYPNEAVGGDYCDVIPFLDNRIGLVIADVSGHGIGPSLLMASARAALRALLMDHSAPEILLNMLGHALVDDLRDGRFITMILASLDPQQHLVEFANAGHAPAVHYSLAHQKIAMLEATGMPLGVLDRPNYPQGPPIHMEVGDLIVLCTDGIVEAMDENDRQFGMKRLGEIIAQYAEESMDELVHQIGAHVSAHFAGDNPPDDLTVLAARRNE